MYNWAIWVVCVSRLCCICAQYILTCFLVLLWQVLSLLPSYEGKSLPELPLYESINGQYKNGLQNESINGC
jgi:hypothetical protein